MSRRRALSDAQLAEVLAWWRLRCSIPTLIAKAAELGVSDKTLKRSIDRALGNGKDLDEKARRHLRELRA